MKLKKAEIWAKVSDPTQWDGPLSRCEDAIALLYYIEELDLQIEIIVCPHCDGPR